MAASDSGLSASSSPTSLTHPDRHPAPSSPPTSTDHRDSYSSGSAKLGVNPHSHRAGSMAPSSSARAASADLGPEPVKVNDHAKRSGSNDRAASVGARSTSVDPSASLAPMLVIISREDHADEPAGAADHRAASRDPPVDVPPRPASNDSNKSTSSGGPSKSHQPHRPSLAGQRSKFDLEPNPFEQSFRGRSGLETATQASLNSHHKRPRSVSPAHTPGGTRRSVVRGGADGASKDDAAVETGAGKAADETEPRRHSGPDATTARNATRGANGRVSLPGIAWIASPTLPGHNPLGGGVSGPDGHHPATSTAGPLTSLGWGLSSSLRSGPLSPALLNGPQASPDHHNANGGQGSGRAPTGFTPFMGISGFPGGGSAAPGTIGSGAFTPGTQALFNMITTSGGTPNVTMPGSLSGLSEAVSATDPGGAGALTARDDGSRKSTEPGSATNSPSRSHRTVPGPTTTAAPLADTDGQPAGGPNFAVQAAPRSLTDVQKTMISTTTGASSVPVNATSSASTGTGIRAAPPFVTGPPQMPTVCAPGATIAAGGGAPAYAPTTSSAPNDFASNPLYLLTAAQEGLAANGVPHHGPDGKDPTAGLDDADVVAAAALTGLGTPGGHHHAHHLQHFGQHINQNPMHHHAFSGPGHHPGFFAPQQSGPGGPAGYQGNGGGRGTVPPGAVGGGPQHYQRPPQPHVMPPGVQQRGSNGSNGGPHNPTVNGVTGGPPPPGSGINRAGPVNNGRGPVQAQPQPGPPGKKGAKAAGTPVPAAATRGRKRKTDGEDDAKPSTGSKAKGGKKAKTNAAAAPSPVGMSPDFGGSDDGEGDDGDEDGASPSARGMKGETDEEKRKNFLERNRQGASICCTVPLTVGADEISNSRPQVPSEEKGLARQPASQGRVPQLGQRVAPEHGDAAPGRDRLAAQHPARPQRLSDRARRSPRTGRGSVGSRQGRRGEHDR